MNKKERTFIATILCLIVLIVILDLATDSGDGVSRWHILAEGSVTLVAIIGIFYLMYGSFVLKQSLDDERKNSFQFQAEAAKWKEQSKKYAQGLSQSIDNQLNCWNLTNSEKEVAFLLLKGLSLKEIAEIRKTAEKTARAQSIAIYSKSHLAGRSELAAFFLEDLFLPVSNSE